MFNPCRSQVFKTLENLEFNIYNTEVKDSFINMTARRISSRLDSTNFKTEINEVGQMSYEELEALKYKRTGNVPNR